MHKIGRRTVLAWAVLGVAGCATAGPQDDLFVAIRRDNASNIAQLLGRGVSPNVLDEKGRPGLVLALQLDSLRAFGALLAAADFGLADFDVIARAPQAATAALSCL